MKIFMNNRILLKISPSLNFCKPLQSLVTSIKQDNLVVQIMIWKGIANMKYAVTGATGKFGQTVIKVLVFLNLNKNLAAMFVFKGLIFRF